MPTDQIIDSIRSINEEWGKGHEISYLITIVEMLKIRAKSLNDFILQSASFFNDPNKYEPESPKKILAFGKLKSKNDIKITIWLAIMIDKFS